jgi:hypothetical protein
VVIELVETLLTGTFIILELFVVNTGATEVLGKQVDLEVNILNSFAKESANIGFCSSNHFNISSLDIDFVFEIILGGNVETIVCNRVDGGTSYAVLLGGENVSGNPESMDFPSGFKDTPLVLYPLPLLLLVY